MSYEIRILVKVHQSVEVPDEIFECITKLTGDDVFFVEDGYRSFVSDMEVYDPTTGITEQLSYLERIILWAATLDNDLVEVQYHYEPRLSDDADPYDDSDI